MGAGWDNGVKQRKDGKGWEWRAKVKDANNEWRDVQGGKRFEYLNKTSAKQARDKVIADARRGIDVTKQAKGDTIRLNALYKEYINVRIVKLCEQSTIEKYDSMYNLHINPTLGMCTLDSLTRAQLNTFYVDMLNKISPRTKQLYSYSYVVSLRTLLKNMFKYAIECEYVSINVIASTKVPKTYTNTQPIQTRRAYTPEEIELFSNRFKRLDAYPAFVLAKECGLRRGECFGLTWDNIDFKKRTLTVALQATTENNTYLVKSLKTNHAYRTIYLQDSIYHYLATLHHSQLQAKEKKGKYWTNPVLPLLDETTQSITPTELDLVIRKKMGKP